MLSKWLAGVLMFLALLAPFALYLPVLYHYGKYPFDLGPMLSLGIGLTTTVFSIVYAALMRGLPYPGAERVAFVQEANPGRDIRNQSLSIHDYTDFRDEQRSFSSLAAYYSGTVNVSGAGSVRARMTIRWSGPARAT